MRMGWIALLVGAAACSPTATGPSTPGSNRDGRDPAARPPTARPAPRPVGDAGWTVHAAPDPADLHLIEFVGRDGWIVTHRTGAVLRTRDGGARWALQARVGETYAEGLAFVDARTGWLCGEGLLRRTSDGGERWDAVTPPAAMDTCGGIAFADARRGLLAGIDVRQRRGVFLLTADAGRTWTPAPLPVGGSSILPTAVARGAAGWLVGGDGVVLADRQGRWAAARLEPAARIRDLGVAPSGRGWAVGHDGLLARTTDGGATWAVMPRFTDNRLRAVLFEDADRGVAAGDADRGPGTLWETTDGGATWERAAVEVGAVHALAAGAGRLWAVGEAGALLSRPLSAPPRR